MAVRIADPNSFGERCNGRSLLRNAFSGLRWCHCGEADIDMDPAAGVGDPEVRFPEFDIHGPHIEPDAWPVVPSTRR